MGCKLSIGIKGDNNNGRGRDAKVSPLVTHEQSTSPICNNSKTNTTTQTSPTQTRSIEIQKDYAEKEADYKPPDSPDSITDNGTESKHSDSKNGWKSKARSIGLIAGRGSSVQHCDR